MDLAEYNERKNGKGNPKLLHGHCGGRSKTKESEFNSEVAKRELV